jgi:hypothetical protein
LFSLVLIAAVLMLVIEQKDGAVSSFVHETRDTSARGRHHRRQDQFMVNPMTRTRTAAYELVANGAGVLDGERQM